MARSAHAIVDDLSASMTRRAMSRVVVLAHAANVRAIAFAYDNASNPKTLTWPEVGGAYVTYTFDGADRLTSLGNGAAAVSPGYDNLGRGTSAGAVSTSTIGYDNADRMVGLAHTFTPTPGNVSWTYAFSPAGQIVSASSVSGAAAVC